MDSIYYTWLATITHYIISITKGILSSELQQQLPFSICIIALGILYCNYLKMSVSVSLLPCFEARNELFI